MNIGEPLRIIEFKLLWIPLPDVPPAAAERPVPEPHARKPAIFGGA